MVQVNLVRRRRRAAFTLAELLIALLMSAVVVLAVVTTIRRQQRFHRTLDQALDARRAVRDAANVLATELRTLSVADTIPFVSDTAIEIRSVLGTSMLCAPAFAGTGVVILAPDSAASGVRLTGWTTNPVAGDDLDIAPAVPAAEWTRTGIAAVTTTTAASCDRDWPVLDASDRTPAREALQVSMAAPAGAALAPGWPVRVTRLARYSTYRAADGLWYLGYRRCGTGGCVAVQPVVGGFASRGSPMTVRALRRDGTAVRGARVTGIARIEIAIRGVGRMGGGPSAAGADSATVVVATRGP